MPPASSPDEGGRSTAETMNRPGREEPRCFPGTAPLAEVSPAPFGTALPGPTGAMVSAFAAPEDVDELPVPVFCADAKVAADMARHPIKSWTIRFSLIIFPL